MILMSSRSALDSRDVINLVQQPGKAGPVPSSREPNPGMSYGVMEIAIIAAVITAVALVLVCLLFLMLRYLYRHKGTYHTNEAKGTEFAESADAALQSDPALQDTGDNSKKEYFI
ncbi:Glycophorin C (Gerbich blood group) [Sigmodon hispidus]